MKDTNIYTLRTFHNTSLCLSYVNNTIINKDMILPTEKIIYCAVNGNSISLFTISNLNILWINFDSNLYCKDYNSLCVSYKFRNISKNTVAIEIADNKFFSAEPNNNCTVKKWVRNWEKLTLIPQ